MRAADFKGKLTPNGQIAVPPGEQIDVVPQWGISEDDAAWRVAGRRRIEAAYAADDSIYESLIHDPSTR
jgi:hypothetical protein